MRWKLNMRQSQSHLVSVKLTLQVGHLREWSVQGPFRYQLGPLHEKTLPGPVSADAALLAT